MLKLPGETLSKRSSVPSADNGVAWYLRMGEVGGLAGEGQSGGDFVASDR